MPDRLRPALSSALDPPRMQPRPLRDLGGLERAADLERLAGRLFRRADRPPGWLCRKMHREHVRPELSWVLCDPRAPDDAAGWRGYMLVGTPPSCAPVARACGLGVAPELRGRGFGAALVTAARDGAASRGFSALRVLAEPERVGFYRRLGFGMVRAWATFAAPGRGRTTRAPGGPPGPWSAPGTPFVQAAWLPEIWARTPDDERRTWRLEGAAALAHLSREAGGWLVQRLCTRGPDLGARALEALLGAIPAPLTCWIAGVDPTPARTRALGRAGFRLAQAARVMQAPAACAP